jgi:VWFA-related protein
MTRTAAPVVVAGSLLFFSATGFMSVWPGASSPSPGPQDAAKPIQHEVSVTLRLVQVHVTDKSGNAIRDLAKEDFVVYDDGAPVTVTEFERHVAAPAGPGTEAAPEEAAATKAPAALARKFFILFDFAFNNQFGAAAGLKAAQHFLDTETGLGDEVAVLSYSSARRLRVHEFLTADLAKAREAVTTLSAKEIAGRAEEIEREYWDLQEYAPAAGEDAFIRGEVLRTEAGRRQSQYQARDYLATLTALAKAMRLVPGRKSFLLFSTGLPTTLVHGNPEIGQPAEFASTSRSRPTLFSQGLGDRRLQPLWEAMLKEFSASDCPFYVFDTREASKQTSLFGADTLLGKGSALTSTFSSGLLGYDTTNPFADDKVTGIDTLRALSKRTGGRYFSNIGSYEKNLADVEDLTGVFYVLGYYPASADDGKFHRVKVEVKRKGARVMAPSGFFDPKPFAQYTKLEKDLHLFDLALNERAVSRLPLGFPVTALAAGAADGSGLRILARVPGEVTARFSGERVEYVSIVFDDKGDIRDVRRGEAEARRGRGQPVVFAAAVPLGPGDYSCRVVVRDMETGLSAVGSARAAVRTAPSRGLSLWTPLLLAEETGCAHVDAAQGKTLTAVPWDEAYAYDKTKFAPVAGRVPNPTTRLLAVVPYSVPGVAEPDVALAARLVDAASGKAVDAAPVLIAGNPHPIAASVTLEIPLAGLAPGTYHLYINAEDRASGTLAHARTTLVISRD